MNGRRVHELDERGLAGLIPGDYVQWRGQWWACTPNGYLGNLGDHEVTEHADGSITVSPSILVSDLRGQLYHGYLRAGVWSGA